MIEAVSSKNLDELLSLMRAYMAYGQAVAFATVYFSFVSSITAKVAVLNDLYTAPGYRGQGIGRKLIEHCRA